MTLAEQARARATQVDLVFDSELLVALASEVEKLTEALEQIERQATNLPHARRIDRDEMRSIARAALASGLRPQEETSSETTDAVVSDGGES